MEFSEDNSDLVEIIEEVGKAAISFSIGHITPEEREAKKTYIDSLVRLYVDLYRKDNEIPSKPLFIEAIDWYIDKTFEEDPLSLSNKTKSAMKKLVLKPLTRYKKELMNGHYGQGPDVALA